MRRILIPFLVIVCVIVLSFFAFPDVETYFSDLIYTYSQKSKILYRLASIGILSVDFLLPVPSSIVMFSNGLVLGFFEGFLLSMIASIISSMLGYLLGKYYSHTIDQYFKSDEITTAHNFLSTYGEIGIIISRGIPVISESVSFVCGNMFYNFKKFLGTNILGYIPVCLLYAYLGSIAVNKAIFIVAICINIGIAGFFWMFRKRLVARSN